MNPLAEGAWIAIVVILEFVETGTATVRSLRALLKRVILLIKLGKSGAVDLLQLINRYDVVERL
jgi:hypothetical protein